MQLNHAQLCRGSGKMRFQCFQEKISIYFNYRVKRRDDFKLFSLHSRETAAHRDPMLVTESKKRRKLHTISADKKHLELSINS